MQNAPLRQPYSHINVAEVVREELVSGTGELIARVTASVIAEIGITNLPERIRSWIYQLCIPHTAGTTPKKFTGKLDQPIDLVSLSNQKQ